MNHYLSKEMLLRILGQHSYTPIPIEINSAIE
jgi:hypothetical protein